VTAMRGKLKKLFAAVLAVLLALSFSGCSELTGLDAQALMSPPKTTADREAIYALMGGGVGERDACLPEMRRLPLGDYLARFRRVRHFGGRELLCKRRRGRHAAGIF